MTQTMREYIKSWTPADEKAECGKWFLEPEDIGNLLGLDGIGCYEQIKNFHANYKQTITPIEQWMCTDTIVGLHLYCLNHDPIMLVYQNARKSPRQGTFITKESIKILGDAWENSRVESEWLADILSDDILDRSLDDLKKEAKKGSFA
jgi:hypothetical protein